MTLPALNKTTLIYALTGLLLVIALVIIVRKLRKPAYNSGGNQAGSIQTIDTAIGNNQQQQTYSDAQFTIWADQLEVAMQDAGTDEDTIFRIYGDLVNDMDYLKLNQAFGVRGYNGTIIWLPSFMRPQLTLAGFLAEELSTSEINELNALLASNGITHRI